MTDRPYRPSNGTEGMDFMAQFCERCERERVYRETQEPKDSCLIAGASFMFDITDPLYPKEWIQNEERGAHCTAFEDESKVTDELREYRKAVALGQKDLFEEGT